MREDYKMKNIVFVLMILLTISIAGGLYNTLQHLEHVFSAIVVHRHQLPDDPFGPFGRGFLAGHHVLLSACAVNQPGSALGDVLADSRGHR